MEKSIFEELREKEEKQRERKESKQVAKELKRFRKQQKEAAKERKILGMAKRGFQREREQRIKGRQETAKKVSKFFLSAKPKPRRRRSMGPLAEKPRNILAKKGRNPFM